MEPPQTQGESNAGKVGPALFVGLDRGVEETKVDRRLLLGGAGDGHVHQRAALVGG
jgi:hypothetical protein